MFEMELEPLLTDSSGSHTIVNGNDELKKVIVRVNRKTLADDRYTDGLAKLATHLVHCDSVLWLKGEWTVYWKAFPHITRKVYTHCTNVAHTHLVQEFCSVCHYPGLSRSSPQ